MKDFSDPSVSLARFYSTALQGFGGDTERLHFAAHSHHLWPDCTREAQLQAWEDAARGADDKWERVYAQVDQTRGHIARLLGGVDANQISLAPNTHEFVVRLFSCLESGRKIRVLTTDSEFHSFSRQLMRYEEAGQCEAVRVAVEPFETFGERWETAAAGAFDLVYFSHVFFNTGFVIPSLSATVKAVQSKEALVVVDGYHAVAALPVSINVPELRDRIFYLGGGYKYAQAGEGICYLYVPVGCELRPANTGWFANYSALTTSVSKVGYEEGGRRFLGATMDFTGAYRFNAVQNWWAEIGLSVDKIHRRVHALKKYFYAQLEDGKIKSLVASRIVRSGERLPDGHFLVHRSEHSAQQVERFAEVNIVVDSRGDGLRVGFGTYHDLSSVDALIHRISMMERL